MPWMDVRCSAVIDGPAHRVRDPALTRIPYPVVFRSVQSQYLTTLYLSS
jgi:hypothetical protein